MKYSVIPVMDMNRFGNTLVIRILLTDSTFTEDPTLAEIRKVVTPGKKVTKIHDVTPRSKNGRVKWTAEDDKNIKADFNNVIKKGLTLHNADIQKFLVRHGGCSTFPRRKPAELITVLRAKINNMVRLERNKK